MSDYLLTSLLRVLGNCRIKIIYLIILHQEIYLKQNKEFIHIEPFYKNAQEINKNENYINELSEKILNDLYISAE